MALDCISDSFRQTHANFSSNGHDQAPQEWEARRAKFMMKIELLDADEEKTEPTIPSHKPELNRQGVYDEIDRELKFAQSMCKDAARLLLQMANAPRW
ncbi:hypothetical protein OQA88_6255 [Cercophora sp. LCS_1]